MQSEEEANKDCSNEQLIFPSSKLSRLLVLIVVISFIVEVVVISVQSYVPLFDLPNHMARHYLESLWLKGLPLPDGYSIHFRLVPNLGGDFIAPWLMLVFEPLTAAKVFLYLCCLIYMVGPIVFILRVGKYKRSAWLAMLFWVPLGFSLHFLWGNLNYYSGIGLCFFVLTQYLSMYDRPRLTLLQVVLHALLVTLLYLWHLVAWGLYLVFIACHIVFSYFQIAKLPVEKRRLMRFTAAVGFVIAPSAICFLLYILGQREGNQLFLWGGWFRKLSRLLVPFRSYSWFADGAVAVLWIFIAARTFAFKTVKLHWLELSFACLLILYFLLPFSWNRTIDPDSRLLSAAVVCALAWAGTLPLKRANAMIPILILSACFLIRVGSIAYSWEQINIRLRSHAKSFELFPRGSKVVSVNLQYKGFKEHPEWGFASWAVPLRGIFFPDLFSFTDQQPLEVHGPDSTIGSYVGNDFVVKEELVLGKFDFVWIYNPDNKTVNVPVAWHKIHEGHSLTVWQVK